MLRFNFVDVNELLLVLASNLEGKIDKSENCICLSFDNDKAKGSIKYYNLFTGLNSIVCDIVFYDNIYCYMKKTNAEMLVFHFCLNGFIEHKFDFDTEFEKFEFHQNIVFRNTKGENNILRFPKDVVIKASTIFISEMKLKSLVAIERSNLQNDLLELTSNNVQLSRQRYLGGISSKTADYLKELLSHNIDDVTGRLWRTTLILSILSSQIFAYNRDEVLKVENCPLRRIELDKIIGLTEFIAENISEPLDVKRLSRLSGINPAKLQKGFNYLHDMSVNSFISETRLQLAIELLDTTEHNISEIVYRIGLLSRSYFSKIFKERFGMSPINYRASLGGK